MFNVYENGLMSKFKKKKKKKEVKSLPNPKGGLSIFEQFKR